MLEGCAELDIFLEIVFVDNLYPCICRAKYASYIVKHSRV